MALSLRQIKLATELAESMNDIKALMQYHKWVEMYSESILRECQATVLARPDIRNRGAYFTTLIKQHA